MKNIILKHQNINKIDGSLDDGKSSLSRFDYKKTRFDYIIKKILSFSKW